MAQPPKKHQPSSQQITVTKSYQGVIPPPDMMEHYAQIDKSFPDRIMTMAEKEGDSRRAREDSIVRKAFSLDIGGLVTGVLVVGGVIWLCWEFVKAGYPSEAAYVACGVLVALAIVFVTRKAPKSPPKQ